MLNDPRATSDLTASNSETENPPTLGAKPAGVDQEPTRIPDAQPRDAIAVDEEEEARYSRLFSRNEVQTETLIPTRIGRDGYAFVTCSGKSDGVLKRTATTNISYKDMVAERSRTKEGRAKRAYFGIDIHKLMGDAAKEIEAAKTNTNPAPSHTRSIIQSVEDRSLSVRRPKKTMLWTEKYRARNFIDLVGDDLTNRQVLRWLKRWDTIVFPNSARPKPAAARKQAAQQQDEEEKPHRKILMITGPPGLGKTTLAHVCARQAGYEVIEINASDDRSRDVVKGRIRTSLGTESVKTVEHAKPKPGAKVKVARPACVVVDEVDGVTAGSGASGEGGFVKALIDLVVTDQKNSSGAAGALAARKKKKGDDFRQMRPLILICNDVYHPSLRPLRQSGLAEIIRIGKPSVDAVVGRLKAVFEKEGIPCEKDAARKLCESAWGMSNALDAKKGAESTAEGDLRGVMVVGEWVAGRLKAQHSKGPMQLTRQWIDKHIVQDLQHGGGGARGLGRGGVKEIVSRVFQEGAGFPRQADVSVNKKTRHEQPQAQLGFTEHLKKHAIERLREMVDTSGEVDRILTDIFCEYPNREFNDDSYLSKPTQAYEWLSFHDDCSSRLYASQEWELAPYLSQPVLACHHLFASPHRPQANRGYDKQWRAAEGDTGAEEAPLPFTGPRADYTASPEDIATDFLPYLVRLVSPDVKPVVVGGSSDKGAVASVRRESEKNMVKRGAEVLAEVGVALVKGKIEESNPSMAGRTQWVYRMDPDLDMLSTFETAGAHVLAAQIPVRYAVRQVLDQELQKTIAQRETAARHARFKAGMGDAVELDQHDLLPHDDKENAPAGQKALPIMPTIVKKDFFGRVVLEKPLHEIDGNTGGHKKGQAADKGENKVWVTYHEGLNNADYDLATSSPLLALAHGLPTPRLGDLRRYTSNELYAEWASDPAQLAYESALNILKSTLTTGEYQTPWLHRQSSMRDVRDAVVRALDEYKAKSKGNKVQEWLSSCSERVMYYGAIFDTFAQHHPEYVSLAWGAMKFLFISVLNHEELLSEISKAISNLADVLPRTELHSVLYPTARMQEAVSLLYAKIMEFVVKAIKWCKKGKARHAIAAVAHPFGLKFKGIIDEITRRSRGVDELANAASKAEIRDLHLTVHRMHKSIAHLAEMMASTAANAT
ncbi:putative chromosome transmission fidelity protein 18 [Diaporthe ampelina]|uniref:Putative chromosome transmission fidelity protein 18 n=1 Tax=Diaporthe ampelina TaxID=1214573 RepID=A0A0G2HUR1_9PEZI|nr:putative chromosome transmission fidelity protein 18 [Diaporthe ampelina]